MILEIQLPVARCQVGFCLKIVFSYFGPIRLFQFYFLFSGIFVFISWLRFLCPKTASSSHCSFAADEVPPRWTFTRVLRWSNQACCPRLTTQACMGCIFKSRLSVSLFVLYWGGSRSTCFRIIWGGWGGLGIVAWKRGVVAGAAPGIEDRRGMALSNSWNVCLL